MLFQEEVKPWPEFVAPINKSLEPLGMKISQGKLEQDGSEWVGLVNIERDTAAKKASGFSLAHQEYFRQVVREREREKEREGGSL